MMRLRRASAIAALCVLASAATAHAECAWVLWHQSGGFGPAPVTWSLLYASASERDCRIQAAQHYAEAKAGTQVLKQFGAPYKTDNDATLTYDDDRLMVGIMGKSGIRSQFYCLPDTVDPRGPKGK